MPTRNNKKNDILDAAIKVFFEKGFHKAKMEDIAKEAGVGKGTIYEYFESKKDLFQEMIKCSIEKYIEKARKAIFKKNTVKEKLIAFAEHHGMFLANHVDMTQIIITQPQILSIDMKRWLMRGKMEIFTLVKEIIEMGIEDGELRENLDADLATLSLLGTVNQYYSKKIFFDKVSQENIDAEQVIDMLFMGFVQR
ncbi:TetR/AcrR family transcriptional regulator [Caloranaerobacter ferrireducens]|uniref:TetR/AcrR family transcriptional regulator n=1 Tax=Caloranaerobacter ferrireducens TaxID=1323370 RepID=UPI00084E05D0|nr:TetR/AcrR family transcriptional regulator [Caloranaerobacter ferrireducens]